MNGEGLLGSASTWDPSRGEFFNEKHKRIAQILADYQPGLRLCYIPSAERLPGEQFPYALVQERWGLEPVVVMQLQEHEINEHLLARVFMNDPTKNDPLVYLEKLEAAHKAIELEAELERRETAQDLAKFMIKSPLHTINLGNGNVIHT